MICVSECLDEKVDDTCSLETCSEHAGCNDDAKDIAITFAHAVKEFFSNFSRVGARYA